MTPLFVSYYTRGSPYEAEAQALSEGLRAFGLSHEICGVTPRGSWEKNCAYKPTFILDMLVKHPGTPIVWVDADARIRRRPDLFDSLDCDIAFHRKGGEELLSGTLYFGPTKAAMEILREWQSRCADNPLEWDQRCLDSVVKENRPGARFGELPASYVSIFDAHMSDAPVILHMQRSRKHHRHVGFQKSATILCPGESLALCDPKPDHLTIGVNRAALAHRCDWWAAMDYPMVRDHCHTVHAQNLLSRKQTIEDTRRKGWVNGFAEVVEIESVQAQFCPPGFEPRLTASCALLFAAKCGCTTIKVYGADWQGTKDYDGVEAGEDRTNERWAKERHEWEDVLIPWLAEQGVKVERHFVCPPGGVAFPAGTQISCV